MPNWCENDLKIKGTSKDIDKLAWGIKMNKFNVFPQLSPQFAYGFVSQNELTWYDGLATYCAMSL